MAVPLVAPSSAITAITLACLLLAASAGASGMNQPSVVLGDQNGARANLIAPRSDFGAYLVTANNKRVFVRGGPDTSEKFADDADLAVKAYEYLKGRKVTARDEQKFVSFDFFLRTGAAEFNPNRAQTAALRRRLDGYLGGRPIVQGDAIYEALVATDGNLTMAFGSLAQLYHERRDDYVPLTGDMTLDAEGKNYYRYAGAFIGMHGAGVRAAGLAGSELNILGNGPVYAVGEIVGVWADFFKTGKLRGADSVETVTGHGKIGQKNGQLWLGFSAAESLRGKF